MGPWGYWEIICCVAGRLTQPVESNSRKRKPRLPSLILLSVKEGGVHRHKEKESSGNVFFLKTVYSVPKSWSVSKKWLTLITKPRGGGAGFSG